MMIVGICIAVLLIILIIAAIMVWRLKVYPRTKTHRKYTPMLSSSLIITNIIILIYTIKGS